MKNKKHIRFCILILCLCMAIVFFPKSSGNAFAVSETVSEEQVGDDALYRKLKKITSRNILYADVLNSLTELNLSSESGTSANQIADISGLSLFTMDNLKTLNVSNNALTELPESVLAQMPNLETLIVSKNQLTSLDVSGCYKLKTVDASGNVLVEFDGYDMVTQDFTINLSNNLFSSMSQIVLPEKVGGGTGIVELYNNNITEFSSSYDYTYRLGLQGLVFDKTEETYSIEKKEKIVFYKSDNVQRMKIVISKKVDNDWEEAVSVSDWLVSEAKTEYTLVVGTYRVEYFYVDTSNNEYSISSNRHPSTNQGDSYISMVEHLLTYYNGLYAEFDVVPSVPAYSLVVNGVTYGEGDMTKIKSQGKIYLKGDEGAEFYYRISGSNDWQKGSEIDIKRGGTYFIEVKAKVDNYESSIKTILINAEPNLKFPTILLLLLIVVGTLLFFGVGYPLLRKYVIYR